MAGVRVREMILEKWSEVQTRKMNRNSSYYPWYPIKLFYPIKYSLHFFSIVFSSYPRPRIATADAENIPPLP